MKRYISVIFVAIFMVVFGACSSEAGVSDKQDTAATDRSYSIVTTIYPEYDWVKNIIRDNPTNVELTILLDNGVDLHSYQPTADDIFKISSADMFIYVGGESDEWVDDVLRTASNPELKTVNLLEILGKDAKEEEVVEGMQEHEHEHDHEDADADEDEHEHEHEEGETEYDEHVWLSLKNAHKLIYAISKEIVEMDPENKMDYMSNANSYLTSIDRLEKEYAEAIENSSVKTLLFADRFPFRYLADDYGLDYYAAFSGCSAETEASFETITFLSGKLDELGLKNVLTIEGSDGSIAKTVIENTASKDQKVLILNSLQSVTTKDAASGTDYLSIMKDNLEVLKKALN